MEGYAMTDMLVGTKVRAKGSLGKLIHDGASKFCGVTEDGEVLSYRGPYPGRLGEQGWHILEAGDGSVVPATPDMYEEIAA